MGTYDDDFYDDDDDLKYTEDDDLDDDESVSSSASVNPFLTGGARTASDRYGSNRPAGGKPIGSGTGRPETPARDPKDAAADRARLFGGGGSSSGGSSGSSSSSSSSSGGSGSGLGNRLSGGMSRTSTPPPRPGDSGSRPGAGLPGSSPSSKPEKKDSGSGGGMLGKLGGMMPGKKKTDDTPPGRPAPPKPSASSGGGLKNKLGGLMPGKGKKDSGGSSSGGRFSAPKPGGGGSSGGGMMGKLGGMLPGRKKKDDDKSKSAGGGPGGARPSPYSSGPSRSGYGQSAAPAAEPKTKRGNPFANLKNRWFSGGDDKKPPKTSKTRAHQERTPHMTGEGLSLDQKLDLLGVSLVFGALVLFFSSLSHEQGALTGTVNTFFSQIFGWGAIGVPIALAAAGIWLIVRHFGDDAPEIDPVRLAGVTLGYVGLLMVFMFIETWSDFYRTASQSDFHLYVAISVREGRGGGWVGAELYSLLVTNFGEISAFIFVFGWLIVSIMLMTRTSAAELAVFVISVWRSLRIALQHRAQRSAALAAEKRAALDAQQEQLRISGPHSPELPAGQQRALPPGEPPIEQRDITIRMGGQMIETGAAAESDLQPAAAHHASAHAASSEPPKAGGGRLGGLTSRLKGAIPAALPFAAKASGKNGTDDDIDADDSSPESAAAAETSDNKPLSLGNLLKSRSESSGQAATSQGGPPSGSRPGAAAFIMDDDDDDEFDDNRYFDDDEDDDSPPHAARPFQPPKSAPAAQSASARPPFAIDEDDDLRDDSDDSPALDDRIEHKPAASGGSLFSRLGASGQSQHTANTDSETERPTPPPASSGGSLFGTRGGLRREEPAPPEDESESPPSDETAALKNVTAAAVERNGAPPAADDDTDKPRSAPGSLADRLSALRAMGAAQAARPEILDRPAVSPPKPAPRPADEAYKAPAKPIDQPPVEPADTQPETPADKPAAPEPARSEGSLFQRPAPAEPAPKPQSKPEPAINPPQSAERSTPPPPQKHTTRQRRQWQLPDFRTLLASGSEGDFDRDQLVQRARIIEETLASFGAPGKVVEINTGPVITQFGVEPDYLTARGGKKNRVKVGAIAALDKDLQLALGARSIRVEAPVPGKGFVGIEVPNEEASLVSLRDVMESRQFTRIKSPLAIALGQSVDGAPVAADLTSMPHLLVAGTTGSGKSVLVNAIIASLLVRNTPDQVRFIMVDPKRVELTGYNGIPHLVAPVVVELERIVGVLKWVTREMDDRYKRFSSAQARNIVDFNAHLPDGEEAMPYIVVIIDELADLMMMAPDETERVITRIAALARATGIHLVIATQRPSVDVVTGLIKANFPARVAFAVAGGVDSRVILDQPGAERLLGKGDMLYMSGNSPAPVRLQGVFVSDMEINNINRFWKAQSAGMEPQKLITALVADDSSSGDSHSTSSRSRAPLPGSSGGPQQSLWDELTSASADEHSAAFGSTSRDNDGHEDELYDEAVELVRRLNKASVSLLQRRLRIGYTRAARLIDIMEAEGIVGPPVEGSKPREVLPHKQ